jgi:hypothetical protein
MRCATIRSIALRCPIHLALCAAPAFAQGADDCASATPISGTGTFNVSSVGSTDSPQHSGACVPAHHDVWFVWTATATQSVDISTCGGTTANTVLAVYAGSTCPASGSEIACNDDACGTQSSVNIGVVSGNSYMIQLGDRDPAPTFSGTFSISAGSSCSSTGPDVIVGDMQDLVGSANQVVGGVTYKALALGTVACNIGTTWVNWTGTSNQHPVIDNNLYKYAMVNGASRFEQVGMSWLKPATFALSDTLCCTGCQVTDGSHLGIHCADPRSAPDNGSQSTLAPRWQVNAASGVNVTPSANPPYSGTVARRCQVRISDLQNTSASVRFFGEAQYVAQDDAAAGNANNNASYREVDVSGSGSAWSFALLPTSPVVREEPAIHAWQALEPDVQLANVDIPGDGRLVLAWKVTDLGGGTWHYEYALFNLNSDLAIRALSVPKLASVSASNLGFHDIAYHDGDGPGDVDFDGTDWPASVGAASIDWATATFAQNPNANALRWGTLYNFRFDADVPPTSGTLTLSTFKTAGSVGVQADVPGDGQVLPFCYGDGTGPVACPCFNFGAAGHGCENSHDAQGALLTAAGTTSPDTLVLTGSGQTPGASSILLQGNVELATPLVFGDGLRCIGGQLLRLYLAPAPGGVVQFPPAGAPGISAQSAALGDPIAPGSTRSYQVYFRDPSSAFCPNPPGNGWNVSNGQRAHW